MGVDHSARTSTFALMRALLPALVLMAALLFVFNISGQERPGRHPAFSDGFRALTKEDWAQVAIRMMEALEAWPEDGELTRVYGRRFEPYIPLYYLGMALYELGCYELSLTRLDESILSKQEIKGAKEQLEEFESLKLKSDSFVRQGLTESDGADCWKWAAPPGKKPQQFIDGIKALDFDDWGEAAEQMLLAQRQAPEDCQRVNVYGMRFKPYLPHYYRGLALYRLGRFDEALEEWEKSEDVGCIRTDRTRKEYDELKRLRTEHLRNL